MEGGVVLSHGQLGSSAAGGNLYGGGAPRSTTSSSSSQSPPATGPIASSGSAASGKMAAPTSNGGGGRKYQCKMCPQVGSSQLFIHSFLLFRSFFFCVSSFVSFSFLFTHLALFGYLFLVISGFFSAYTFSPPTLPSSLVFTRCMFSIRNIKKRKPNRTKRNTTRQGTENLNSSHRQPIYELVHYQKLTRPSEQGTRQDGNETGPFRNVESSYHVVEKEREKNRVLNFVASTFPVGGKRDNTVCLSRRQNGSIQLDTHASTVSITNETTRILRGRKKARQIEISVYMRTAGNGMKETDISQILMSGSSSSSSSAENNLFEK